MGFFTPSLMNHLCLNAFSRRPRLFTLLSPPGGLVTSGGLLGFVFSRNLATLSSGVLFGGALLALSTFNLKIWRLGKSSLPFILGQAALSAALLWKNFQRQRKYFQQVFTLLLVLQCSASTHIC
ncbi:hypothetical protein ACB092_09G196500 [Castanea dentata]